MPAANSEANAPSPAARGRAALLWLALLLALAVVLVVGRELGGALPRFAAWVDSVGIWGPLTFIAGYVLATVAAVPGSLLTLAAGAVFGLAAGTLYVFVGATLGAAAAFGLARHGARGWVERRLEGRPRFRAVDRAVAGAGLRIVFLLRLSPLFPFNLLNYALGLTRVRFRDYLLASIGMLPGTFLYVYYGKALGTVAAIAGGAAPQRGAGYWALLAAGLAATAAATALVTRLARRALAEEVQHG